jgi:hypothetical protein
MITTGLQKVSRCDVPRRESFILYKYIDITKILLQKILQHAKESSKWVKTKYFHNQIAASANKVKGA